MASKRMLSRETFAVGVVLLLSGIITIMFGTACEESPSQHQPSDGFPAGPNPNFTLGYATQYPSNVDLVEWRVWANGGELISSKFRDVGLNPVFVGMPPPPPPRTYMSCDTFYFGPDEQQQFCGDPYANSNYIQSYKRDFLRGALDTLETVILYLQPSAITRYPGVAGYSETEPYAYHNTPGSYYGRLSLVFKQALTNSLAHFGVAPADTQTYKTRLFGITGTHELGAQIGLTECAYDSLAFPDNVHHRLFGYSGKCIMWRMFQWDYIMKPESVYFCRDPVVAGDVQRDYIRNTCRDSLHQYIGIFNDY